MNRAEMITTITKMEVTEAYGTITSVDWKHGMIRLIPPHMRDGILLWVGLGIQPGSFLASVIKNDLFLTIRRADEINKGILHQYVEFFTNYAPAMCFGSEEKFSAWERKGGLGGHDK